MPPNNTQSNLSPEQAKAAMGNATYLQDQILQSQGGQNAQNGSQTGGVGQDGQSSNPQQMVGEIVKQLMPVMQEQIKAGIDEAMGGFRKEVKALLEEDDKQGESTKTAQ